MAKIDTSGWKKFLVGKLFDVVKGTRLTKANMIPGDIRFIGSSAMNNGCTAMVGNTENMHPANTITVCYNGSVGETFYQDRPFLASDDVNVLYPKFDMTKEIALFIAPLIKSVSARYNYVDKWKQEEMIAGAIKLPVDLSGEPDWAYMDEYMSAVMRESEASLESLRQADEAKHALNVHEWREFIIGDLFEKLQLDVKKEDFNKTFDVSEKRTEEFNLPLVNAKHGNNGIMYCGREADFETAEMTIDIVQNGAIATGDVYAQPQRTGVLWDAYLVKPKAEIDSAFTLMFLATVLEKAIKDKFSYDDKCVWDKAKLLTVTLPCTSDNEPDWAYMDEYMRTIMESAASDLSAMQSIG